LPVMLEYTEPWGKIFSKSLIEDNKICFEEVSVANDYMFSVQTGMCAKRIKTDNRKIYIATTRKGSVSYLTADTIQKLETRIKVTARVQQYLKSNGYTFWPMLISMHMHTLFKRDKQAYREMVKYVSSLGINTKILFFENIFYAIIHRVANLLRKSKYIFIYKKHA